MHELFTGLVLAAIGLAALLGHMITLISWMDREHTRLSDTPDWFGAMALSTFLVMTILATVLIMLPNLYWQINLKPHGI